MLFDSWNDLLRIVVVGALAYVGLILLLRTTGKRTLSKMNAFDLVVTVALGSTLASGILSSDVSLAESLLAFVLLCALQYAVTFFSVRSRSFQELVKAEPTLVFHRGRFIDSAMRHERVTEAEVLASVREAGAHDLQSVEAVVLETDGTLSVIPGGKHDAIDVLRNVTMR